MGTFMKFFFLLVWIVTRSNGAPKECVYKHRAQVMALLALHNGENCEIVQQRGFQQAAALQSLNQQLNAAHSDQPQIEVEIFDTCSRTSDAVNAALKGLVKAQQGCMRPMFLGFLGPEDPEEIQSVARVISVFNYPHIVLESIPNYSQFNTFEVETALPAATANIISSFLREINWKSFFMAFTPDEMSTQIANRLLGDRELCLWQGSLIIPTAGDPKKNFDAYDRLLQAIQKGENSRILVIVDKAESAETLLNHLENAAQKAKFLIYLRSTGILPWRLSTGLANNVLILQETSKSKLIPKSFYENLEQSPIWAEFKNQTNCGQICNARNLVRDSTTTNIAYAVYLFHEALRKGVALKCRGNSICSQLAELPKQDWRDHLEGTSLFHTDQHNVNKIAFHSFLPREVDIFAFDQRFELVGSITDDYLDLPKKPSLPITLLSRDEQCEGNGSVLMTTRAPIMPPKSTPGMPIAVDIFGFDVKLGQLGYYELVAILTGAVFGCVLILLVMICLVYRCFRVKVDKSYSSPSSTSGNSPTRKKSKLDRRRFFRSSERSMHTVRE